MVETHETLLRVTNFIYGGALLTSPFWGTGVLLATVMMNDSSRFKTRFQMGCLLSLVAEPISLIYTLSYQNSYGFNKSVSFLPLLPLASYVGCFFLFWNDKIDKDDK
ncbi:hypothetical protein DICPUDRAFT_78364 [Dictyostelium purpureum]|uniref:Uncharacterized protein n=1 Tax=Dictyostelium purpureum TaxID=5786 RepID=F0ZJC0_DICPU|nr:uncharacterized protein DICPUDRAFT_78364 [Dictyostelium purpureum]EGC35937.1 hypothetical protein DICPUDRAFT_78364 [Dictyostelium purpureum]|eukprot:XP_003287510.1 hypothetical protein DICPUDRAFT_78364 [Dictyostelium purpureum]